MQMYCMHRRQEGLNIAVNSINPGGVVTNFGSDAQTCFARYLKCMIPIAGKSPKEATRCSINCATNPALANISGIYFDDFKHATPNAAARNENKQELLWKKTFEYLRPYVTDEDIVIMEGK